MTSLPSSALSRAISTCNDEVCKAKVPALVQRALGDATGSR